MDPNVFECFASSERAAKAASRIHAKTYDVDSWNLLIKEANSKNIEEVEGFYEELIKIFPTCTRFWKIYIEHELRHKKFDKVSELFKRCLEDVISIELYKCYLNYIKETKADENDLIFKAYRFTLDKVGIDPSAAGIWHEYIQFLKDSEVSNSYLESQKISVLRKAYQEGILNPMFHIDNLWKEYVSYEQSINPIIAEKMTQDRSRDHMNARRVAKEWEVTIRGLNRSWPAVPPTFSSEEIRQLEIWRKYILWERANPMRTENNHVILRRVSYAYRQFLLCFGHHPHVWHEFACYLDDQIKFFSDKGDVETSKKLQKEETALYERATKGLMSSNLLLHFAYADFQEAMNERRKALQIYNNLIELGQQEDKFDLTLVYIQLMKFTRRTEGIKAARAVFKRAREDETRCGHQMYTATALMEYYCTKDQVIACKIFEAGCKKFNNSADYILSYIHFMNNMNEENNTRVLFERVLTTCPLQVKDTIEIWNSFLEFEAGIGDLSSITKVEKRRTSALEKILTRCTDTSWAVDRYKFQDLYPCTFTELKSLRYDPQQSSTSLASIKQLMTALDANQSNLQVPTQTNSKRSKQNIKQSSSNKPVNGNELLDQILDNDDDYNMNNLNQNGFFLPDLDQMLPFKPIMTPAFGSHTVPGGVFPPPPAVSNLLGRLPQPGSFWGPFVDMERLIVVLREVDFDALYQGFVESRRDSSKQRVKKVRTE